MEEGWRAERVRWRLRAYASHRSDGFAVEGERSRVLHRVLSVVLVLWSSFATKTGLRKTISPPLCLHKTKKKNRERDAHTPPAVAARAVASQRPVPPHPSPRAAGTTPPPAEALPPSTRAAPSPLAHAAARSCLVQQQTLSLGSSAGDNRCELPCGGIALRQSAAENPT